MDNLEEWSYVPDEDYTNLTDLYDQIVVQYRRYVGHVGEMGRAAFTKPPGAPMTANPSANS
jgi:hypothetical protein